MPGVIRFNTLLLLFAIWNSTANASDFSVTWQGSRQWAGPQSWSNPLYDWRVKGDQLVASAGANRTLHQIVHRVENPERGFALETRVKLPVGGGKSKSGLWAGFAVGLQGLMDSPRHVLVGAKVRVNAGVRRDGRLILAGEESQQKVSVADPIDLVLTFSDGTLSLKATQGEQSAEVRKKIDAAQVRGNIALVAHSSRKAGPATNGEVRFEYWRGSGDGLAVRPELAFGPIHWSQYTRQGNRIKLLAQMAPVGSKDAQEVDLDIKVAGEWNPVGQAPIDSLSRTAIFDAEIPEGSVDYRVRYQWLGKTHYWHGTFAADPSLSDEPLKIGVLSCDHGYAFPLTTLVRNVEIQNPNLMFFAGDQIYEIYGGFKLVRKPVETAMLDYLRKYYQFGWTWRELLKDRPSIIIPDDHDVFQGNIWGAGGRPTKDEGRGGYVMPPAWVNAVQKTQTGHLPDPVDPSPIEQGITVYYTKMDWGGASFAIIEDRKWKSGFRDLVPNSRGRKLTPEAVDIPGASLLGDRQEAFLQQWSKETQAVPVRFILSQTIFCKGNTHSGPKLNKTRYVYDTNGWPQSGRRRALSPFRDGRTIMLHGDQHLGLLVRQGLDSFDDGPFAFMVPGTANGWPRAWWPDSGTITGQFTDAFGNRFTVLGAANPEKGTNQLDPRRQDDPPEETAHRKGSGYGMVHVAPGRKQVTFEMWRYLFDAEDPRAEDQFEGFPVTVNLE